MAYHLTHPIRIAAYDPCWPLLFQEEQRRLFDHLGSRVELVAVEHFGSTSVPGLGAKPILDLLAGVRSLAEVDGCVAALHQLGYEDCRIQVPGRRLFSKGGPYNEGTHHLHFVEHGSPLWHAPLDFRDRLRADPELAREYEALKRRLADLHQTDLDGYTDGKGAFIQAVVSRQ